MGIILSLEIYILANTMFTVPRGVFRALWKTYDGAFFQNVIKFEQSAPKSLKTFCQICLKIITSLLSQGLLWSHYFS